MSDRDVVLAAVRGAVVCPAPHPGRYSAPVTGGGLEAFASNLAAAGGTAAGPVPAARLPDLVTRHLGDGRAVAEPSAARRLGDGPWSEAPPDGPPHAFEDVDTALVEGALGVAESGAVAVGVEQAPHRALLFLAARVILLLDAARIVDTLHQGLVGLSEAARTGYHLTWVCGPSKTADIEQTLVLGAHGPRSLVVALYRDDE